MFKEFQLNVCVVRIYMDAMAGFTVSLCISMLQEKNDSLKQELANLEHWRSQTLPDLRGSLKFLGV